MEQLDNARHLLRLFKGDLYINGFDVLPQAGPLAAALGKKVLFVCDRFPGSEAYAGIIARSLAEAGLEVLGTIDGAAPNAPREDLARIAAAVRSTGPDVLVSFGGGSTIDAAKAAAVLGSAGGTVDDYFGTGLVTAKLAASGAKPIPHLAIQTAASSGAHLTKYSNITDLATGQKKLIVDEAIVPQRALFDYGVTAGAPPSLTADGALDGVSHCLEVLYGAAGKPGYPLIADVAAAGIRLVLEFLPKVMANPAGRAGREALGLATDLGAYSIMLGGTNGAHLTSFSLIDILSHGRACALMNPYYTVFFAPAIQEPLRLVARICEETGVAGRPISGLSGRDLGVAVAEALIAFGRGMGLPATLGEVPGFSAAHVDRALTAAKNPQLRMKLENMPVPLTAEMVDTYMGPVLQAAVNGDLGAIRNVA
jgi:alcohol dehydrogenase